MKLPRIEDNLNIHQSLPNKPNLEAQELKKEFDKASNILKDYVNNILLPLLEKSGVYIEDDVVTLNNKIFANGGIEGNVKGNLEGNATSASKCTGNSASATTAGTCTRKFSYSNKSDNS